MTPITHEELVERATGDDPRLAAEWERLSVARAVAATVIAHRSEHGLTQRDLAKRLGVPQPQIARLESGEHEPSHRTLMRLASRLGLEFTISIAPAGRPPAAGDAPPVLASYETESAALRFSAHGGHA